MSNTTDNFELIAQDAVATLTAVILTLKAIGGFDEFAGTIADDAEELCLRAIAIG